MLTRDGRLLFSTRIVRLYAYGFLSVVLALYLAELGLSEQQIGLLLTATLVGDAVISLGIASFADRIGRKRMLLLGAGLMIFAGLVFAFTHRLFLLVLAAIIGTISPSGNEVGPFLSIEQAALPQTIPDRHRTQVFSWYNLVGSFSTALGALSGGLLTSILQNMGSSALNSYRAIVMGYALLGVALMFLFFQLSSEVEVSPTVNPLPKGWIGLHRSRGVVARLAMLFALDSVRGWTGGAKLGCLLVSRALWGRARDPGYHLFWSKHSGRVVRISCRSYRCPVWADQHNGLDAYPFQPPVDLCPSHAEPAAGNCSPPDAFQHFPDGCAYAPVLYYGCR